MHPAALVLVVEDDPDIRTLLAEVLSTDGFDVRTAQDGRHGLAELRRSPSPAIVVLDMMMPELDGFGFLEGWRDLPASARPPVLATSAFDGYLPAALKKGAAAALRKPFDLDALVSTLRWLLGGAPAPSPLPLVPARDEAARLRAVLDLKLEQPAPTDAMDEFVQRVARLYDVPVCLVSIVTADRQFWHAFCGLPDDLAAARGTPRGDSFCSHAVVARSALVVQDTHRNPLFQDNVLVRTRGLRFYAGVPLTSRYGAVLGTLCLLDFRPRPFGPFDLELLSVLARRVVAELEWRERRREPDTPLSAFRSLTWLDEELDVLGREAFEQVLRVEALRAAESRSELTLAVVGLDVPTIGARVAALKRAFPSGMLGRLDRTTIGLLAPGVARDLAGARVQAVCGPGARAEIRRAPRLAGGVETFLGEVEASIR